MMTARDMKVTFLLPDMAVGGAGRAIVRFADELALRGHSVRVLCKNRKLSLRRRLSRLYIERVHGPQSWLRFSSVLSEQYTSLDPSRFQPGEVVLAMCTQTAFDMKPLIGSKSILVTHCHGAEFENWERMIESWRMPTWKLTVSHKLERMMREETGQEVISVVPDGVDCDEYYPAHPEGERAGAGASFRWSSIKDPQRMISVFKRLHREAPDAPLVCFGNGRKPSALPEVHYIRLPTVAQARELYSRSRVWFLTSLQEGFGMPILEAMACGCVPIATRCGGPEDVIRNGENGFLLDIGNEAGFVHKIKGLLADNAAWSRMSDEALKTAKMFSWRSAAALLEESLREVIGRAERG